MRIAPRREVHAHAARAPDGDRRVGDLEHQACTILDRSAVFIGPMIGAILQELVEQIAVGPVDLDAIEAGAPARSRHPCGRLR